MRESFTLYELQRIISAAVEQALPLPVWVSAEIAELKVNYSGHCYIELIEKEQGAAKAQAKAVIWKNRYPQLSAKFEGATERPLTAGMKILAQVSVSQHPLYGLSLQIVDIDPAYTLGDMEQQKQQTIAQLKADGVWDINRTLPTPKVVQRVAVVSSATAAGYRDFIRELSSSPYNITTTLFEAVMQGEASEGSVTAALSLIAEQAEQFDIVAIIRGGGSTGDLDCFNAYLTASYVAQFPLPVITGIGHDKDVSVVDMVAKIPLKTPTAVATWICNTAESFDGELEYAAILLEQLCTKATQSAELKLQQYEQIVAQTVHTTFAKERQRLDSYTLVVENFAPQRLLQLGYAVAKSGNKVIRSTTDIECGDIVTIEVSDGIFRATVVDKNGKES